MLFYNNVDLFEVKEHLVSIKFKNLLLKTLSTPVQKGTLYRRNDYVMSHLLN